MLNLAKLLHRLRVDARFCSASHSEALFLNHVSPRLLVSIFLLLHGALPHMWCVPVAAQTPTYEHSA
jgi:hypothetical protein